MSYYVVRQKIDKSEGKEKVRYHGVPVASGQVGMDELAKDICGRCSLTEADVYAAVIALSDVMQAYLMKGNTVYLKDIGSFSVSAGSEGYETPDECTPSKVKAQRVCFKADKEMRGILGKISYSRSFREATKK
ncbi:HU family DNA-binding protein [uncultured Bacteroides sp.]|uniref:HU family DNA-binding protein n=1 Tax=uncultured Bacteroides sp. TaxID=162156 RepID=UPI002AAB3255|nr:HU family DNA-binding protein [uncultured Bacteroides sp.]